MSSLSERIARQIAASGPLNLAQFMALALLDPARGYYRRARPLGREGDFITAPEVSQVFGECLGFWCVDAWERLGRPVPVNLIELGPGRGTLMNDVLRAVALVPELAGAIRIHLVEVNEELRTAQRQLLAGQAVQWHEDLESVPPGPFLLLANEFVDALPIRQFERAPDAWRERLVALGEKGAFVFTLSGPLPASLIPEDRREAPPGTVIEASPAAEALASSLAERVCSGPGAALLVDYGYVEPPGKGTLQGVRRHRPVDPLSEPGATDLSALVDFAALARAAERAGAVVLGPVNQGELLAALGAAERFDALRQANSAKAEALAVAERRLSDPEQMGTLFKALAVLAPSFGMAAGFPPRLNGATARR